MKQGDKCVLHYRPSSRRQSSWTAVTHITKMGRKYFQVESTGDRCRYHIDTKMENTCYGVNYVIYDTPEEWWNAHAKPVLAKCISEALMNGSASAWSINQDKVTIEQMRAILEILGYDYNEALSSVTKEYIGLRREFYTVCPSLALESPTAEGILNLRPPVVNDSPG